MISVLQQIRKTMRDRILDLLSFRSESNPGIHILNGHFLSRDPDKPAEQFMELITKLKSFDIQFLNFDEAVKRIDSGNIPKGECCIAFSFDDGLEECYTKIKPVLDTSGIRAGFFINPGFINGDSRYRDKYKRDVIGTDKEPMSWAQIAILEREGHIIGAHTVDHVAMNIEDKRILEYQAGECKSMIENEISAVCNHFAFPFGQLKHIGETGIAIASKYYRYLFSQDNYRFYFSFNGRVINRRHFECDWPYRHVLYFLKSKSLQ